MPKGCLLFVIVVFPDNTHLLFFILDRKPRLICFIFIVPMSACEISVKNIDDILSYNEIKILDL